MTMITFEQFRQIFDFDNYCGEILFRVNGTPKFHECWMGKHSDKNTGKDTYWYGLTPDGENAFDFSTFEEFSSSNVFDGKSLSEIWENVILLEINACDAIEMLKIYLL